MSVADNQEKVSVLLKNVDLVEKKWIQLPSRI